MHLSSRLKMEAFLAVYASESQKKTVLDVGSRSVRGGGFSYRKLTDPYGLVYTGLDMEAGFNVDIVPANPYIWTEIDDEQFDFVISGQAFEHNPFMWVTFCEIARVLKQGGRAIVIAPSAGKVHRFPFDCWRYYPDSWAALCSLANLELTESIREQKLPDTLQGRQWVDSAVVATKRQFKSEQERHSFYSNLAEITAPFKARQYEVQPAKINDGPTFQKYLELVQQQPKHLGEPRLAKRKQRPVGPDRRARLLGLQAHRAQQTDRENHSVRRLTRIGQLLDAQSYLEIGISKGNTFRSLKLPKKVGVDPQFKFNPAQYRQPGVELYEMTSDVFFADFAGSEKFDMIFIDGLHIFQQAYRDFCNSINHAHDRTVWLIDDVIPSDEFSALPDQREAVRRREKAGVSSRAWHGDVYKVIFAIHDLHPNYTFVTVNTEGNPQTIVWKSSRRNVIPAFGSIAAIEQLNYSDFLKRRDLMNLLPEDQAIKFLQTSIAAH